MSIARRDMFPLLGAALVAPGTAGAVASFPLAAASGTTTFVKPDERDIRAHLGITENPYGPSAPARRAIVDWAPHAAKYPQMDAQLIRRISEIEQVPPECVHIANGSLEALSLFTVAVARVGHVLAPEPTYATHLNYAARQGVKTHWFPLARDHQIDLEGMAAAVLPSTTLVYICNPNNPTGLLLEPEALKAFARKISARVPVLVDEAFIELAPERQRHTLVPLVRDGHDVIVTRTFSKVYGMGGLRIGYAIARPERVKMLRGLTPTSRNGAGLAAAMATLGDETFLRGSIGYLTTCREKIYRILETNGVQYLPSNGGYVYADMGRPAKVVQERLRAEGVTVRLFEGQEYQNWMRIGTATPAELDIFANVLPKVLSAF